MSETPLTKEQLQQQLAHSAFIDSLHLTVLAAEPEKQQVVMRAEMRPEFERGRGTGQWHGGPIAAIIDTVGDYALVHVGFAISKVDEAEAVRTYQLLQEMEEFMAELDGAAPETTGGPGEQP